MELKAGYKQTEIGVIPQDWEVVRLSSLLTKFQNGYAFPSEGYKSSDTPIITMSQIGLDGKFQFNETEAKKWDASKTNKLNDFFVDNGDILIAMTDVTPKKNLIGRMTIAVLTRKALLNQRVGLLKINSEKVISGYLVPCSSQRAWRDYCKAVASLGVQANIGTSDIKNGQVAIPPTKREQSAIAEALCDTDALIESLDQLIAKKRQIKQGAMQELLTGKRRLPGFSGEWTEVAIKKIVQTPVTDGPHLTPVFLDDGVPFLSVNNLVDGRIDFSDLRYISVRDHEEFSKKCKPQVEDILLGKAASVGKVALVETDVEFNIWSPIALIRVNSKHHAKFVYYQLQGANLNRQIALLTNSSSQGNIGMGDIEKLVLPLPDKDEQLAIATVLSDMDTELAALDSRLAKARQIKQGMMQELLTGRIRLL